MKIKQIIITSISTVLSVMLLKATLPSIVNYFSNSNPKEDINYSTDIAKNNLQKAQLENGIAVPIDEISLKGIVYPYPDPKKSIGYKEFFIGQSREKVLAIINKNYQKKIYDKMCTKNEFINNISISCFSEGTIIVEFNKDALVWKITYDDSCELSEYPDFIKYLKDKYGKPVKIYKNRDKQDVSYWYLDDGKLCLWVTFGDDKEEKSQLKLKLDGTEEKAKLQVKYYYVPLEQEFLKEQRDNRFKDF